MPPIDEISEIENYKSDNVKRRIVPQQQNFTGHKTENNLSIAAMTLEIDN
jgi:hypothetical protein